jgi:TolA-binding protein
MKLLRIVRFVIVSMLILSAPDAVPQDSKQNADFKLAINLFNDGLFDLAAEQLKQFISAYPNTDQGIEARFYLGRTQLKLEHYDESRLTFQTFALTYQNNPRAAEAWWYVGESFASERNYKEAALAFERVKVFHPKSKSAPEALVQAGRYFHLAGERENARRVLRIVLQEYGSSPAVLTARTQLGQIYFSEGNLTQAQNELKRVVSGDPSPDARAQALLVLANIYGAMGRTDQAVATYQEIVNRYKKTSAIQGAYVNLGRLQTDLGRYDAAIENLQKALEETDPIDSSLVRVATISLGNAYAARKDYARAVSPYQRYLSRYPSDQRVPEVQWKLALAAGKGGKYSISNDMCQTILRSAPADSLKRRAQILLGMNAEQQDNPALALQHFSAFVEQHGDDPTAPKVLLRMGRILEEKLEDHRRASVAYELLASRYRGSPWVDDALFAAGRSQEEMEDFETALQSYRELATKYPASDFLAEADKRISIIETFDAKDKDSGLEKLAILVGDVVAEKDRGDLAYRLGEIYFDDLKNYQAAATQFTNAYTTGLRDSRKGEALYLRSKSYEYLSWKDQKYRVRAIESYETFLKTVESEQTSAARARKEDAAIALFSLSATNLAEARLAYTSTLVMVPQPARRHEMLLRLGRLQEEADSLKEALATFGEITLHAVGSPSAEEARYRRVTLMMRLGLTESAMGEGQDYLKESPNGPHAADVLSLVAGISADRRNYGQAIELYERLTSRFYYTTEAENGRRLLADARLAAGEHGTAIRAYASMLEDHSADLLEDGEPDPALLLALGKAEYRAGQPERAKPYLFRVAASRASSPIAGEALTTLGMIYQSEGAPDVATSYFRQASAIAPETAATRDVADLLFESGEYPDAIKQYTQLSRDAPNDTVRQYCDARIIIARLRTDNLSRAERKIDAFKKRYRNVEEDLASFELEKGNLHFRKKSYSAALKTFRTVESKYDDTPSAPTAAYWVGRTLEATRQLPQAIEQLDDLIKEYPDAPVIGRAHLALGNIYFTMEKWDLAIQHYRKVVDDPDADPSLLQFAMSNLINTYETAGVNDAALALTRRYLQLYPESEDSFDKRVKIGILYERLGYHDQAIVHLQGLLDEAGSDLEAEIRYYIGEANYNKGDYQQAILDFLKVPYLVTKKGKVDWIANSLYMSGQSYEKMGRHDQALAMYQQIIDRSGIDDVYKAAARKEINRVKLVLQEKAD